MNLRTNCKNYSASTEKWPPSPSGATRVESIALPLSSMTLVSMPRMLLISMAILYMYSLNGQEVKGRNMKVEFQDNSKRRKDPE